MGVPTIGGQISGAVTEGSGLIVTGDLDDVGFATGNTDDVWSISVAATYGVATIDPATGTWSYDLNDSHPAVQALGLGDTLTDVFTVLMVDADGRSDTQVVTITISGAPCFVAGTPISTAVANGWSRSCAPVTAANARPRFARSFGWASGCCRPLSCARGAAPAAGVSPPGRWARLCRSLPVATTPGVVERCRGRGAVRCRRGFVCRHTPAWLAGDRAGRCPGGRS
ncbi:MAG: VCBS domain-containing protein [Paracoccaceae bacterium]